MKRNFLLTIAGISLLAAGCATSNQKVVLEGVGPDPALPVDSTALQGTLMVYSAYQATADFNSRDPRRPEYTDYQVLDAGGKLLQWVHNSNGTIFQRPQEVYLPSGNYQIIAHANGYGRVTVPVTIEPGVSTLVHLEGGYSWPLTVDASKAVKLPNGEIVGWKSSLALK